MAFALLVVVACQAHQGTALARDEGQPEQREPVHKERRTTAKDGCVTVDQVLVRSDGTEVEDGPSTTWFDNGSKLCEGRYVMGKKDGVWRYWRRAGGLRTLETYRDGAYDGVILDWGDEGDDLMHLSVTVQGIPQSLSVGFHTAYIPSRIETYKRGSGISGTRLWFHEYGMPARFAEYKDDKLNGKSVEWAEDGTRTKVEQYKNDEKEK
jgi:antitoxin component YwqK of YwqJK toxin-antitoxin module